jgi:signal transduction histidine kinase
VSLRTRLLLALAYVLLLAIVALEVPLALSIGERVDAEVRSQASNQALLVAACAADADDPRECQGLAGRAAGNVRGRVLIVDGQGTVRVDSAGTATGDFGNRPEIAAALAGRTFQERRRSETLDQEILATAVPVRGGGAVRITQSVDAVTRAVNRARLGLALIGLLVLAIGLALGYVIANQVARPLSRLEHAARQIGEGDLDARAPVEGSPEQRTLATAFNEMTGRMARLLKGQQEFVADASHQLRTPLTGLRLRLDEARAAGVSPEAEAELREGEKEIDRLAATIDELLILSRAGEHDAPGELVLTADAARRAGERWRVGVVDTGVSDQRVWCAPADLDRAIDALVENAVNYSPPGSEVTIVAEPAAVVVLDEGPGLAAGEEALVVERFHRGSAGRAGAPGTGLGLAIARELMSRWHADVKIANRQPGPGAAARIDFAKASPEAP